jgi:glycosidase
LKLPPHPLVYEINTWAWLTDLSRRYGQPLTLASIPAEEYDALASWGFDAIWLMGVWERSPAARELARRPLLLEEYRQALPDISPEDVVGSAYAIHRYMVDSFLGGPDGLAQCRAELARRGLGLILDYVPNHVALDHSWLKVFPECAVQGDEVMLSRDPITFFAGPRQGSVIAHGRDPFFPAWSDTAQLNIFAPVTRQLARLTLEQVSKQCDGVRCDMAMLLLNRVFASTWRGYVGVPLEKEFWAEIISAIKVNHAEFLFIAEAYWETEGELQALGFDYTYDKGFYDALRGGNLAQVRGALSRPLAEQARMLHFAENHDEDRAVVAFGPERSLAAASVVTLSPGMRLLHEGQLAGWRVKTPVQLGRRLPEATDLLIQPFYRVLLAEAHLPIYHQGSFLFLPAVSAQDEQVLAFCWIMREDWRLVIVNCGDHIARVTVALGNILSNSSVVAAREVLGESTASLMGGTLAVQVPPFGVQVWRRR